MSGDRGAELAIGILAAAAIAELTVRSRRRRIGSRSLSPEHRLALLELVSLGPDGVEQAIELSKALGFNNLTLDHAEFPYLILSDADLAGAKLSGSRFSGMVLLRCDISGADFSGSGHEDDVDISDCRAQFANFASSTADFIRITSGTDASGINLSRASIHTLVCSDSDLSGADLRGLRCQVMVFRDCDLRGAKFDSSLFRNLSDGGLIRCKADPEMLRAAAAAPFTAVR